MRYIVSSLFLFLFLSTINQLFAQTVSFNAPDTVCRGQNITVTNTSTGQSTNLWNFCKQAPNSTITGVNIGNVGINNRPTNFQIYKDGNNYIGFDGHEVNGGAGVRRINFGTNLLNPTPTVTTLSTFSGQLDGPKGMQFLNENGNWYGFYVADNWTAGYNYQLVRLDFGNSLLNTPTIINFGTLGGVINEYLTDIEIKNTTNGYIGFISTASGRLFRIVFGSSITNIPVATNLGIFGSSFPTRQISIIYRRNSWFLYYPKDDVSPSNCSVSSLNFGNSLLNTPTYNYYGNPGNLLNRAYDFLPFVDCDNFKGYVLAPGGNKIIEYTFPNDIFSTTISGVDLGNIGNLSFPSSFSDVILFNNDKYVFVTNTSSSTITRLKLSANCNSFGVATSSQTNPPVFHIDSVGTYNVSLTINENLNTEARYCKEIVVIDSIKKPDARINTISCSTDSIRLTIANIDTTASYTWTGPNGFSSTRPNVSIKFNGNNTQNGSYIVTTSGRCGSKKDTVSFSVSCLTVTASFTAPDTVCKGQNITIANTTTGQSTNLWNFCKQSPTSVITGVNLGNSFMPSRPTFINIEKDGNNYVAIVSNDNNGNQFYRLNFGTNLLSTPTFTNLGTFGGLLVQTGGLKILKDNNNWYCFVAANNTSTGYHLVRLDFGTSLLNTPTINDFGNLGGIIDYFQNDLDIIKTAQGYIGFLGIDNGKLLRLNFGNNITNTPTAQNLGTVGGQTRVSDFALIFRNNSYYLFMPNDGWQTSNYFINRLNFGNSLLNTPTSTNLGNPGNLLNRAYDFLPFVDCNNFKAYQLSPGNNTIIEYTFPDDISSNSITGVSRGNIGQLNFPSSFSNVITFNNENYVFVPNAGDNKLARLKVSTICNGFGIPSSSLTNPPVFHVDSVGTYNISLVVNENLSTESRVCHEIVVLDSIKKPDARINTISCSTDSIRLTIANIDTTASYTWTGPNGFSSTRPNVSIKFNGNNTQNGSYIVTTTGRCGSKKDTVIVNANCVICNPTFTASDTVCKGSAITITNQTTCGTTYKWDFCKEAQGQLYTISALPNNAVTVGPVQCNVYKDGVNYIGFFHNYQAGSQKTVRLNYGTSVFNNPTYTDMGNFGNTNFNAPTSMDIIKEGSNYYGFATNSNNTIGRLDFGTSLLNTPAIGAVINIGRFPLDIKIVKDGNNFYGFIPTVGGSPSTGILYKVDFGTSLTNASPTITNMGNFSALGRVISINIVHKNNNWYLFAVNDADPFNPTPYDNTIAKLSFGSSLSNTPTAINFGNPSAHFNRPQDLLLYNECQQLKGYVLNLTGSNNNLIEVVFNGNENGTSINTINRGNQTLFNGANSFSNVINVGNSKITFIANAYNNNILRMDLSRCNNVGIPTSTNYSPPAFNADSVGVLNVTLTMDEGLVNETQVCKQIIVLDTIHKPDARINTISCSTDSIRLSISNIEQGVTYAWTGPNGFSSSRPYVSIKFTGANQAGQYIVTATGRCGTKKDTVSFIAPTPFVVNLGRDTSICQGNSITLNATTTGTVVTYLWSTGAQTPTIIVNTTGTYWVKVTADGCSASDTIKVTILTPPNAFSIGNDTTYCGSFSRVLSTGNASTVWNTGVTASQITVTQAGTYIATITNSCGFKKDTILIKQNNIPLVNLGRDTSICQGNSIMLNATTTGTVVTYLWSTGAQTPTIIVNTTGTYWVKVTADGCSASDTIKVTILTPPNAFSIGNDTTYCGSFSRVLSTGNASTVWNTGVTASQITVTQAGTYIATITNSCGTEFDSIIIQKNEIPTVVINKDTIICAGSTIELVAITDAQHFLWNTGDTSKSINIKQFGIYWVNVTNNGCIATDTAFVDECEGDLWVPNAFTPNNDGRNDVFQVFGKKVLKYQIIVFSRWGERLFESNDINNSWDGTYKDEPAQVDAYAWVIYYTIQLKGKIQEKMKKGSVTLLR